MIDVILIARFIVDYFWEYKILSIAHVAIISYLTFLFFCLRGREKFHLCKTDIFVFLLFLVILQSYSNDTSYKATIIFLKLIAFIMTYFVGRILSPQFYKNKLLSKISILLIVVLFLLSFTGYGVQQWGSVKTFSGGYFFKADLALAVLIYMAIVFSFHNKKSILIVTGLCSLWLVALSNSRISIPLIIIIPLITSSIKKRKLDTNFIKNFIKFVTVSLIFIVIFFSLADRGILGPKYLSLNFKNFYSGQNTQGRAQIWYALITGYGKADISKKTLGLGLNADQKLTSAFSESKLLEGSQAHSVYLRVLVTLGIVGSIFAFLLSLSLLRHSLTIFTSASENFLPLLMIFYCLFSIFLITGLTIDSIIRPQIMVPLSLFSGMIVQSGIVSDKQKITIY